MARKAYRLIDAKRYASHSFDEADRGNARLHHSGPMRIAFGRLSSSLGIKMLTPLHAKAMAVREARKADNLTRAYRFSNPRSRSCLQGLEGSEA